MKFVAYYVQIAEFNILSKIILTWFYCILFKYHKSCNTICDIIPNLILYVVQSLLDKNPQFISYIINNTQELLQAKIKNMFLNN